MNRWGPTVAAPPGPTVAARPGPRRAAGPGPRKDRWGPVGAGRHGHLAEARGDRRASQGSLAVGGGRGQVGGFEATGGGAEGDDLRVGLRQRPEQAGGGRL